MQSLKLVPPSLRVLARILTDSIDLSTIVIRLGVQIYLGRSWVELEGIGYPPIKIGDVKTGPGLVACMTSTRRGSLLWLHEIRCHNYCGILGPECSAVGSCRDWLEKIYQKHEIVFDSLPST
jgi:hypothetical protein